MQTADKDLPYIFAAYKQGIEFIDIDEGLSVNEFTEAFESMIDDNGFVIWTMFAVSRGDGQKEAVFQPVGLAMGFWPHPKSDNMVMDRLVWFPWASPRNRIEAAVHFFVNIRHEIPMIGFAKQEDGPFFIALLKHGMLRRVGTSYTILGDEPAQVYETRSEH